MVELIILFWFLIILGISGIIADYIFPHIKPLNDFIDSLPMMVDDEEENDIYISRKENKTA